MITTTMGPMGRLRTGLAATLGVAAAVRRGGGGMIGAADVYDPSSIASSKMLGWVDVGGTYGVSTGCVRSGI